MMAITARARRAIKRWVLGSGDFPQQCPIGLQEPQSEVAVWLLGREAAWEVTHNHFMACGAPFSIGVGLDCTQQKMLEGNTRIALRFLQQRGKRQLLGEIGLHKARAISVGDQQLYLFQVKDYRNYCLPATRLWARYLQYAYQRARGKNSDVAITRREVHAMIVFYLCPRPVVLVSARHEDASNVFPMNLMGQVGSGYFCFSLNGATPVAKLVERSGRVALSSIPLEHSSVAFQLGKHHRKENVDLNQLPFAMRKSPAFGLPIPEFALRVREMKIESTYKLGSHTMFIARMVHDERWRNGQEFFVEHGIHRIWQEKQASSAAKITGMFQFPDS